MQKKAIGFLYGQVGDAVMCSVAARNFKSLNPDVHLTFALGRKYANAIDLFRGLPYIDDFHVWDSIDGNLTALDEQYIESNKFAKVFNPLAPHKQYDWFNHRHYIHETCDMLDIPFLGDYQCELGYKPNQSFFGGNVVTTSLFSSGHDSSKAPDYDTAVKVFKMIQGAGFKVVQIGSGDKDIDGALKASNLTLLEAVDAISSSICHLTIDTAFSWIASAYNRPVVGLYGKNYAGMASGRQISHNPYNRNALYLNRESVKDISAEEIFESVMKVIDDNLPY